MSYATQNVETTPKRAAQSLIRDSVLSAGEEIGGIFLRGVFIACGSITDPQKD
jgi:DNA-binding transcriptional regulator WhiA